MLVLAAIMIVVLGLAHSVLGEKNLIRPILNMEGLPVILGSPRNTRATIWVCWHMITLMFWGMAAIMLYMHFSSEHLRSVFLITVSVLFAIFGMSAVILSRGAHRSWVVFLPVSAVTGYLAWVFWSE